MHVVFVQFVCCNGSWCWQVLVLQCPGRGGSDRNQSTAHAHTHTHEYKRIHTHILARLNPDWVYTNYITIILLTCLNFECVARWSASFRIFEQQVLMTVLQAELQQWHHLHDSTLNAWLGVLFLPLVSWCAVWSSSKLVAACLGVCLLRDAVLQVISSKLYYYYY